MTLYSVPTAQIQGKRKPESKYLLPYFETTFMLVLHYPNVFDPCLVHLTAAHEALKRT